MIIFFPLFISQMDNVSRLEALCAQLSQEEAEYVAQNRIHVLGNLGTLLVPKHFVHCDTCGESREDLHTLSFFEKPPFEACKNCMTCFFCKRPNLLIDGGIQCVNVDCSYSPAYARGRASATALGRRGTYPKNLV